ncbi:hypothetical protein C7974DRAFT_396745 [Boeremia exigua]|uniref:uncharacterized protein n=1 Tax=Boeremia exigua TaxID=749465 RepID=UPI001E8E203C|nr:uncharacterized protein C7974DRAFT_396745 [Boeremia exigua]KAH6625804.1 hypothetical protein C7974DRAFT_396745 [Boeremia exigua]
MAATFHSMLEADIKSTGESMLAQLSNNITSTAPGNKTCDNIVALAWRNSLFAITMVVMNSESATKD